MRTLVNGMHALIPISAVLLGLLVSGCSVLDTWRSPDAAPCQAQVDRGVLPPWARDGFRESQPVVPHAIGRGGEIAAVLFGDPLTSPPGQDHDNKILWVARQTDSTSDLVISAQRMDGTTPIGDPVERTVRHGPGPSIIDLPSAGCWRLGLTWGGLHDRLDLEYIVPTAPG